MTRKVSRVFEDASKKAMGLKLLDVGELLDTSTASDNTMNETAETTEAVSIGQKNESALPTDEVSCHLQHRAVRVNMTLLVQHFIGDFG